MPVPAVYVVFPSVFVICRSALGAGVSVSVAVLLPGVGSVIPGGAVMLAVLVRFPVAPDSTVPDRVNVMFAPLTRLTGVLMLPLPLGPATPLPYSDVHVALASAAGTASNTVAPIASLGPTFLATMVYVSAVPAVYVVLPSVLVICRSASGFGVSVSVAELLPGVGSVTPGGVAMATVFVRLPVAPESTVPVSVNVMFAPLARFTRALMLPLPFGPADPLPYREVHVAPVMFAGTASVTLAPMTLVGPTLVAKIV